MEDLLKDDPPPLFPPPKLRLGALLTEPPDGRELPLL